MKMSHVFQLAFILVIIGCARPGAKPAGSITIKGAEMALAGNVVNVGEAAPDFTALDQAFKPVALSQFKGKAVLISAVPSLDTGVCAAQTKRFNDELAKLPADVVILTLSTDLPFVQKRFCASESIDRVQVLSDSAHHEFGDRYGVMIPERGLLARSVFVVGKDGKLTYKQVVPELTEHPDYDAALAAIAAAAP